MQVGDLVTCEGTLLIDGEPQQWIGIITSKVHRHRVWVWWNDGKMESTPINILEAICK